MLILDSKGKEQSRLEGYLPKKDFRAALEMGLGRIAFKEKKWGDAERLYNDVARKYPDTGSAPDAMYWSAVSRYKGANDHTVLGRVAEELSKKYPESVAAKRASPWAGH